MKAKRDVMLGGDPEMFIYDTRTGTYVPSTGLVGGDKGKGVELPSLKQVGAVGITWLEDNVSVELNFTPMTSPAGFNTAVQHIYNQVQLSLQLIDPRLSGRAVPVATFTTDQLNTKQAQTIGCDPDCCAYNYPNTLREPFPITTFGNSRYGGGHLHLGFNNRDQIPPFAIAMLCDAFMGLPSIVIDRQGERRAKYGLAGLYREKSYGLEYRTMSNWWMHCSPVEKHNYSMYVYRVRSIVSYNAFHLMNALESHSTELASMFSALPFKDIQDAINTENQQSALELYKEVATRASAVGVSMYNAGELYTILHSYTNQHAAGKVAQF